MSYFCHTAYLSTLVQNIRGCGKNEYEWFVLPSVKINGGKKCKVSFSCNRGLFGGLCLKEVCAAPAETVLSAIRY